MWYPRLDGVALRRQSARAVARAVRARARARGVVDDGVNTQGHTHARYLCAKHGAREEERAHTAHRAADGTGHGGERQRGVARASRVVLPRALASAGTLRNVLDLSSHTNTPMQREPQAPREEIARHGGRRAKWVLGRMVVLITGCGGARPLRSLKAEADAPGGGEMDSNSLLDRGARHGAAGKICSNLD